MDLNTAYHSTAPTMVDFNATVTSAPSYFFGSRTKCVHETFAVQSDAGPVSVVDNVALAPRVPVSPGDRVEVCGEMVHDPGKLPLVHWTHHDPAGKHPDGFIQFRGRRYA
jgi:hypothetical protein